MDMSGRPTDVSSVGRGASASSVCHRSHPWRQSLVPRVDHQWGHVRRRRLRRCIQRVDDDKQRQKRRRPEPDLLLERRELHSDIATVDAGWGRQTAAGAAREPLPHHHPTLQVSQHVLATSTGVRDGPSLFLGAVQWKWTHWAVNNIWGTP